jgi:citrate synthase
VIEVPIKIPDFIKQYTTARPSARIAPKLYNQYNVKRGLRNADGTGVLVGLTEIGGVHGYIMSDQERVPAEGILRYRGIDIADLATGAAQEGRLGFEEIVFLLLFGFLPTEDQLVEFTSYIGSLRALPPGFTENMILKAPSQNMMNKLARSVLAAYSYDDNADDTSIENVLRQSAELIARFPTMAAYAFQAKSHYYDKKSLFIHEPDPNKGTAENFLRLIRANKSYTPLEAETLDLALILHAEHGGGNNSAFTCHVVTSSGTDTYSAIAGAVGALKGPLHGGAANRARAMMRDLMSQVKDWSDEKEVSVYLTRILKPEAFDQKGLIYGMGHPVYTLSDPRAKLLSQKAASLAEATGRDQEYRLYRMVETLVPAVFQEVTGNPKVISANVDFYSGLVYDCLDIPADLFTPIFAVARIAGWCAHRVEELVSGQKIIRPAYKDLTKAMEYVPISERRV